MKILWFDVETTGLYGWRHDIIQFAYIVEIDREVKEEGVFTMQPMNYGEAIDEGALKVHGISRNDLMQFQPASAGHRQIVDLLNKYPGEKFTPACYNAKFDMEFLQANFKKHQNKSFSKYFDYHALDPMALAIYFKFIGAIKVENVKLKTVAEHFGIDFKAHDALEDIRATRSLAMKFRNFVTIG